MNFADAVKAIKEGKKVKRRTWLDSVHIKKKQGRDEFELQKMVVTDKKDFTALEILADDWEIMP